MIGVLVKIASRGSRQKVWGEMVGEDNVVKAVESETEKVVVVEVVAVVCVADIVGIVGSHILHFWCMLVFGRELVHIYTK